MPRTSPNLYHEVRFLNHLKHLVDSGKYFRLPSYRKDSLLRKLLRIVHKISATAFNKVLRPLIASILLSVGYAGINKAKAQTFAPYVINPFGLTPISVLARPSVTLIDIDGDSRSDLFVADYNNSDIWFQKNIGTDSEPLFDTPVLNPFGIDQTSFGQNTGYQNLVVTFSDLDGDGDYDLFLTLEQFGLEECDFVFVENTGSPTNPSFGNEISNPFGLSPSLLIAYYCQPTFVDIDHDADLDLFVCRYEDTTDVIYYENTGSSNAPSFVSPLTNPFNISPMNLDATCIGFADIDCDADLDMVMGGDYALAFLENAGTASEPAFAIPDTAILGLGYYDFEEGDYFSICDLDNDGDPDILVGNYDSGDFVYFENLTGPCSVYIDDPANKECSVKIQPNPFKESATILLQNIKVVNRTFVLYDILGKEVRNSIITDNTSSFQFERGNLSEGTYLYQIRDSKSKEIIASGKMIIQN